MSAQRPSPSLFRAAALRGSRTDLCGAPLDAAPLSCRPLARVLGALVIATALAAVLIPFGHRVSFDARIAASTIEFLASHDQLPLLREGQQVHASARAAGHRYMVTATIISISIAPAQGERADGAMYLVTAVANDRGSQASGAPLLAKAAAVTVVGDEDSVLTRLLKKNL